MKSKRIDWSKVLVYATDLKNESKEFSADWFLSLYLNISLHTGLRAKDILNLKKSDFNYQNHSFDVETQKTNVSVTFHLPTDVIEMVKAVDNENIFFNQKYGSIYSLTWVNARLKKKFGDKGVSSHSIRKAVGLRAYEFGGINGARNILAHTNFKHTSTYLELDKVERTELQKQMFNL